MEEPTHGEHKISSQRPSPTDFDNFLPWACSQLSVEAVINITRKSLTEYVSAASSDRSKPRGKKLKTQSSSSETDTEMSDENVASQLIGFAEEETVNIETIYDNNLNLVQLKFKKNRPIPRPVFKLIGLALPFHKFLNSITINSGLNMGSVYELSKFLPISHITELCLDGTFIIEANYHILLGQNALQHLSLAKCNINDVALKTIASKLFFPYPASKTLFALNLATNRITDVGVKYLAEMLRSNRNLSYLNLADNMITDSGAISIFNSLKEFSLTAAELKKRRERHLAYLKDKVELVYKTAKEVRAGDFDKKVTKRKSIKPLASAAKKSKIGSSMTVSPRSLTNVEALQYERAEAIVQGLLGPFRDPYDFENTGLRGNEIFCYGNNTLCYLNLAYNNITYFGLKELHNLVLTQRLLGRKPKGLINVNVDGNFLPVDCDELEDIDDVLETGLSCIRRHSSHRKRQSMKPSTR